MDFYLTKVPIDNKESLSNKNDNSIPKFNFKRRSNNDTIPEILKMPRICPLEIKDIKKIKYRLAENGIKVYQNKNEDMEKEKKVYLGSFKLNDENKKITTVLVPVYDDNKLIRTSNKEINNLKIPEFQEDNDVKTDEEQLDIEIKRQDKALLDFMEGVEKDNNYINKNLEKRKKKK